MSVYRIYVEKKPEFAVEANSLIGGIKSALGLENLTGLRVITVSYTHLTLPTT